jgi:hypothetical protein
MERVEVVGSHTFVLRTRQVGPACWCCDVYEKRVDEDGAEEFLLEEFGESELEAFAMALSDAGY